MNDARPALPRKPLSGPLATLWPLLGRPVALHRRLVDVCGGVKTALFLSQCLYWTHHGVAITATGGWFHKRRSDWQKETGLGRRSQERARQRLVILGALETRRAGLPARLEFRVNLDALVTLVNTTYGRTGTGRVAPPEPTALFGAPLAFHASLVELTGSVTAGLLLSSLLHLSRRRVLDGAGDAPWVIRTTARWMADTGLSRREFDGARDRLADLGVVHERVRGVPPTLQMHVDLPALARALTGQPMSKSLPDKYLYVSDKQGCRIPATKDAGLPQARLAETYKLDCPERTDWMGRNVHNRVAETAKTIRKMTTVLTTDVLPPPIQVTSESREAPACGGGESTDKKLTFPTTLNPAEQADVSELLRQLPSERAQLLLDELEGRLHQKGRLGIPNPVGYVRRLRDLQVAGCFVPELARSVQDGRLRQADEAARREAVARENAAQAALMGSPEYRERQRRAMTQARSILGVRVESRRVA